MRSNRRYELKSAIDVAVLMSKLDNEGQDKLVCDLVKLGYLWQKMPKWGRFIARIAVQKIVWIDDGANDLTADLVDEKTGRGWTFRA